MQSLKKVIRIIRQGQLRMLLGRIIHRLYSTTISYGIRRDLSIPVSIPPTEIPLRVRPIKEQDVPLLFFPNGKPETPYDHEQRMARYLLLQSGPPTCYVAATQDTDKPCFMLWLFNQKDNEAIQHYFHQGYPRLKSDEAMMEYAFTLEEYRGKGVLTYGLTEIPKCAANFGARHVIAFVDHRNIPSMRSCQKAGFRPYMLRKEKCRFFRRTIEYEKLVEGSLYPFEEEGDKEREQ